MNVKIYEIELRSYSRNPVSEKRYFYINDKNKYECSATGCIYFVGTTEELNILLKRIEDNVRSIRIYAPVYNINDFKEE